MNVLFPDFRLATWFWLSVAYIACLLDSSPANTEISFAFISVLGGIALAAGVGASIYGAHKADKRQKAAIAAQKEQERKRRAAIRKTYGPEMKRARARLKKGKYGLSTAREREMGSEITQATQAATKDQLAELERGDTGTPFGSGRREALKEGIASRAAGAVGEGRLGTARVSEQIGQQQQAADRATTANYASMMAGLPASQVPGMMMQSPGMSERMAGIAGQTLTGLAGMGAFSPGKPDPSAAAKI